jgi:hypothetical protein
MVAAKRPARSYHSFVPRNAILSALPTVLEERLGAGDDRGLWAEVLRVVAEDASVLLLDGRSPKLYATIGACSHWLRPHQSRWTAGGGFAAPYGYGDGKDFLRGLPNLDWSVVLQFDHAQPGWVSPQPAPAKRFDSVRLAVPSRTARHLQAAVHATWSRGTLDPGNKKIVHYGFRKSAEGWKAVARQQQGEAPQDLRDRACR